MDCLALVKEMGGVLAYVDGGSGSMLLQAALAGAFAAAYGLKGVVGRVVSMFRKGSKTSV